MKKILTLFFLILTVATAANAQYHTTNKKAILHFEQGINKYRAQQFDEASELADKALKLDPNFIEAYWLIADISATLKRYDEEIDALNKVLAIMPDDPTTILGIGDAYFDKYDNENALRYYRQLKSLDRAVNEKQRKHAEKNTELAEFRLNALANPVDFNPRNLGAKVNTVYNDYFPSLSADGNTLVYTIELPQTAQNPHLPKTQEDIYISRRTDEGPWQQARSIGATINTHNNEGAPFLSADGKILLFTSCTCPDGLIRCCDIYYSYYKDGEFTYAHALPAPVNTGAWESQPSFSADNKTLFFVSNRQGGFGGKDIWYSVLTGDGRWSEPINCGENINTPDDEMSPFIHADNKTLYFSSNGHPGMGGHDLFVSHLQEDGTWGKPINLGYPINTKDNETRLAVSVFGNTAIISSDRHENTKLDLYEITLPKPVQPNRTLLVCGVVKDNKSNDPLKSEFEIVSLADGKTVQKATTAAEPMNIMLYLPEGNDYALNVRADGYLMNSMNFSLKNIPDSVTKKYIEIGLDKPTVGNTVTLENVFFDTDKYDLKPESFYELNKLVDFLKKNPTLRIELGGHTDNAGKEPHNLELSQNRAMAIVNYLVSKDIDASRLTAKGYGSSKPCVPNDSKENMAKNRRTEFKIIQ